MNCKIINQITTDVGVSVKMSMQTSDYHAVEMVCFEVTSRAVAMLSDEEERLMPLLNDLSRQYLDTEYGSHRAASEHVTMDQVDGVSSD